MTTKTVDLPIAGMTCAACARRIERRLSKQNGVETAVVNFATERAAAVKFNAETSRESFIEAVRKIRFDVLEKDENREIASANDYQIQRHRHSNRGGLALPVFRNSAITNLRQCRNVAVKRFHHRQQSAFALN